MRAPYLTWTTISVFLLTLAAPAFVPARADANAVNPPVFLRNCDGTLGPEGSTALPIGPWGVAAVPERATTRLLIVQTFAAAILLMLWTCVITGGFGSPGTGDGQFSNPAGIAAVEAVNRVFIADTGNHRIQVFTLLGVFLFAFGALGSLPGQLLNPFGLAHLPAARGLVGTDAIYVADAGNDRIQYFDLDGNHLGEWGSIGAGSGEFNGPQGVAVDVAGNVYVADTSNHRVQKFTSTGTYLGEWGSFGTGDGQFDSPASLEVGPADDALRAGTVEVVYVSDTGNDRVQIFDTNGDYLTQFGSFGFGEGEFAGPADIAIDENGEIFVADQNNFRVQVFGYPSAVESETWGGVKARYRQ